MPSLRKKGDTYYLRQSAGRDPVTGRRRQTEVTTGRTNRADAEVEASRMIARTSEGLPPLTDRTTVKEWLTRWLDEMVAPNLAPATVRSYRGEVERHIAPLLGGALLRDLRPQDLASLYARKAGAMAPAHAAYLHRIIHRALRVALKWGLVARNVADAVDAPRVPHRERPILTADEAKAFLRAVRGDRLYALFWLALETGLREGELCARRWSDLDERGRTLAVPTKLQREKGRGLVEGPTKARRPRTRVPLSAAAVEVLTRHRRLQDTEREAAGSAWDDGGWIFCWQDGRGMDPGWVSKHFHALAQAHRLPKGMRFHDLRHTSAAIGAAHGEPLEVIADRLGHRDRRTTLGMYGHHLPAAADQAAAKRASLLSDDRTDEPHGRDAR